MPRLSVSLLGPFRVSLDDEPVTDFATVKSQALLAYLSVEADYAHRRRALGSLLWPDQPSRKARQSLRQALYRLRRTIKDDRSPEALKGEGEHEGPFLFVDRHTIRFNIQSDHWLDVATFTSLAKACRDHWHRGQGTCLPCLRQMERIVALYQGEFLERFSAGDSRPFEEWVLLKREWFHRKAIEALIHLANYHERRGDIRQARRYARRQVEMEPWREEAHRQLMRLLALDGQRSAALAQYKACRTALTEELGIEPTRATTRLYEELLASTSRKSSWLQAHQTLTQPRKGDLPPPPTPFVGREKELAELAELLANPDCRLITLVGPGGVGKSRLALRAATEQVGNFAHRVAFVSLRTVCSTELLVTAIADAVGFSFREEGDPEQQLLDFLREREFLLVLDGMEHILQGADVLAKILRRAPGVIMLITSQERLNLREEWVRDIQGLAYPRRSEIANKPWDETAGSSIKEKVMEGLDRYSALQLFRQQAHRVNHRFSLSARATPHVLHICQLVEGLPLAIELAAAWTGVRSCQEIAEEIERTIDVLHTSLRNIPKRQRSVRATFEHSWQLLSQTEKELLARLSVFRGGFQREAVLQVTGASPATLAALVDKSLVRHIASDRHDMHGLLTQFAAEKLQESPHQHKSTEIQHARFFTVFLQGQTARLKAASNKDDFLELAADIENARQAWQMSVTHDRASLVERSVESLYLFYDSQCRFQEGVELLSLAIEKWGDVPGRSRVLGKLLSRQGALYLQLCDYQRARARLERSLRLFQSLDLATEQVFCLVNLAGVARRQGDYEKTVRLSERSLDLSQDMGYSRGMAHSLLQLGLAKYRKGDVDRAQALVEESLAVARGNGSPRLVIGPLNVLGDIACHRGDYAAGQSLLEKCLTMTRQLDDQFKIAVALNNLGTVFHVLEKHSEARSAYQESLEICREIGDRGGQAVALSNLGEVSYAAGAYIDAQKFLREGLAIGRDIHDPWTVMACLNNLGEVAYALRDQDAAKRYFAEALTIAQETHTLPLVFKVLVNIAGLLARQGEKGYAAELLTLACRHTASEEVTREKAKRLLEEMQAHPADADLPPVEEIVSEALTRVARDQRLPPNE